MSETWKKIRSRLRSPAVWAALLALVLFVLKKWLNICIEGIDTFVELLMSVLVAFGVLNNPDTRDAF